MIPSVDDLRSDALPFRYGQHFNPPALTNFLGTVQADADLTGVRSLSFPPLFAADAATAKLFLDGQYFIGTGTPIDMVWQPDRIERTARHDGLSLRCVTALAVGETALVQRLSVTNDGTADRSVDVRLTMAGRVTRYVGSMTFAVAPDAYNNAAVDEERGAVVFTDPETGAANVQGVGPGAPSVTRNGVSVRLDLAAGATGTVDFVSAMGDDASAATVLYDRLIADVQAALDSARDAWNAELEAVVTPGNDRYSGHLPVLETDDADLLRLYWMGILGVIYFKRESPHSVLGRTYDTLLPRYWPTVTFLWDYSLSSTVHALLDPEVMRRQQAHWMNTDIHTCMGTEWLTGAGLGAWYAVNDYAMTRLGADYLRWTGDFDWLRSPVGGQPDAPRPVDELVRYAQAWRQFESPNGLADYGGIGNLLECVSTYVHEVASLNAANVYSLRTVAELLEREGDGAAAELLRTEATELVGRVLKLYAEGEGYWHARYPDGTLVPVRHCYDLATVLYAIPDELSERQRREMCDYFERELRTETWMKALSNADLDAAYSVRADHQWNGAYCAWPSEVAAGLYGIGEAHLASKWIKGLARSANQGPFGQAHFIDTAIEPHAGGARKVPGEVPFINDWACSSGGSWVRLIIEGVFGVRAGFDGITASPTLGDFDPDARLVGLSWQGTDHVVDRNGIAPLR